MTTTIEIRELVEIHLRGGVLIDCINGANNVNSAVGKYIIEQLNMQLIAAVECESFPSITTVIDSKPNFPMRIYSNQENKVAAVVSDFTPDQSLEKPLGRSLITWARSKSIALIITMFQVSPHELLFDLGGTCSTGNARLRLDHSRIDQVESARITGIPAVLLNEGNWANYDVISLLVQTSSRTDVIPSVTETIIQGIDILLPEVKFDYTQTSVGRAERIPVHMGEGSASAKES